MVSRTKSGSKFINSENYRAANLYPEDITKTKSANEVPETYKEKDLINDITIGELLNAGSAMKDPEENTWSIGEDNNYYNIGGVLY